jgi:hypothetical protein
LVIYTQIKNNDEELIRKYWNKNENK